MEVAVLINQLRWELTCRYVSLADTTVTFFLLISRYLGDISFIKFITVLSPHVLRDLGARSAFGLASVFCSLLLP